jgi:hypothetical protein
MRSQDKLIGRAEVAEKYLLQKPIQLQSLKARELKVLG